MWWMAEGLTSMAHRATDKHLAGGLAATTSSLRDRSLGLNLLVVDDVLPLLHGRAAISGVACQPFTQHVSGAHDDVIVFDSTEVKA